jgi:hypothetical protein
MIPGYKFYLLWRDLYPVYGGEIDWFYGSRGIYMFSNELFTNYLYFGNQNPSDEEAQMEEYDFDKYLLFGDALLNGKSMIIPNMGR